MFTCYSLHAPVCDSASGRKCTGCKGRAAGSRGTHLDYIVMGDSIYSLENSIRQLIRRGGQSLSSNLFQQTFRALYWHQVVKFHVVPKQGGQTHTDTHTHSRVNNLRSLLFDTDAPRWCPAILGELTLLWRCRPQTHFPQPRLSPDRRQLWSPTHRTATRHTL